MNKDFLQSEEWFRFQEAAGNEVVRMTDDGFSFGGIVYSLPFVGKYLYTPRFPDSGIMNDGLRMTKILSEARRHGCGWVRVEPGTEVVRDEILRFAQNDKLKTVKAPHDMQPKETFVVDLSKGEEELLAAMKPKTRYNVRLAEKKGVRVFQTTDEKYRKAFIDLVTGTADRKGIVPHPRKYYETMLDCLLGGGDRATESFSPARLCPGETLALRNVRSSDATSETVPAPIPNGTEKKISASRSGDCSGLLFVAEHEGDILGINFMTYHGGTATYLHGGSSDTKREYMAPFLLQWEAMKDAKRRGCNFYDFGGIRIHSKIENRKSSIDSWAGITRFKIGFSPNTTPTIFPGCYDIVLSPSRYFLYTFFSGLRSRIAAVRKSVGV